MSNGQGCTCNAWSENECACGADWTPQEVYDLRAENNRLKAELASLTAGVKIQVPSNTMEYEFSSWHRRGYNKAKDEMHQEVERLKAELAEAKRDAGRYRWLRDVKFRHNGHCLALTGPILWETNLDAACDAAMKGK